MPHITGIKTAADVELQEVWDNGGTVTAETDPTLVPLVQYYKHFDLSDEQLGRTTRYNCWAFTFLPRRYWINSSQDVDQILADNCLPMPAGALRPGDVIRYRDSSGVTTHTGRVWEVDGAGSCVKVRSKWGSMGEYVHAPLDAHITPYYGTNLAYFRQVAPLKGIGDLWVRDAPGASDNGEQYSSALWTSPDILVDAPPFGSTDVNPIFSVVNRVSAMVHNRSDADIPNARVRYYWADPHAGFAPSHWTLIPGVAGHPNPTDPFTVPANTSLEAPYAEWTPVPVAGVADPAHQCLLAVAFVNDDPKDSSNPNPLVYPFDIRWENNIAARNVHIVSLKAGGKAKLDLATALPFDGMQKLDVNLRLRLDYVPRLPIFGFPKAVTPLKVALKIGDRRPVVLETAREVRPFTEVWGGVVKHSEADRELSKQRVAPVFLPSMAHRAIAWKEVEHIPLTARKPVPLHLEIEAPVDARPGTNFYLSIEQLAYGDVTGSYTVVVTIV
jgi:hypothetical protein